MDIGAFWALVWVLSIVGMVLFAIMGEATISKSPAGVNFGILIGVFCLSTLACVWIASGLHVSISG